MLWTILERYGVGEQHDRVIPELVDFTGGEDAGVFFELRPGTVVRNVIKSVLGIFNKDGERAGLFTEA
jgi:hypothetical protein